ncbi:DUF5615 family PIN-like protein [Candidatus Uabimicrobium amorphum]|uniref:DUF5615 domain-containing protein n=1 Tax=Uabimicrobium amorphum TaxID=2596890 RepID=A0A5S9IMN3_UABAM|nr:DUF5615 family PIN-like protein [Candidatus Uabimicrobium amorphum]BBM83365.1 hypothetical protein UABAM_01717 [Candidatus Uabimicrobium amorphum]
MIQYYFDIHVFGPVYDSLTKLGIDVLRGQDDGKDETADQNLLRRATELKRVLVTADKDFFEIASDFQNRGEYFCGIVYYRPIDITIRNMIEDLQLIAQLSEPEELCNLITFLPIRH